jgi:hypothetical protein
MPDNKTGHGIGRVSKVKANIQASLTAVRPVPIIFSPHLVNSVRKFDDAS